MGGLSLSPICQVVLSVDSFGADPLTRRGTQPCRQWAIWCDVRGGDVTLRGVLLRPTLSSLPRVYLAY